jgi:hypothetical protein
LGLLGGENAGGGVDDAEGAEGLAFCGMEADAGEEAQGWFAYDERVGSEAGVHERVLDDEHLRLPDGVGAEGDLAGSVAEFEALGGAEPLLTLIEQGEQADGSAADGGGKTHEFVALRLGLGV